MNEQMTLQELRARAALSQEELSRRSGVSQGTLSDLERGKRAAHPGTRRKLAEALGVEPQSLAYLARTHYRRPTTNSTSNQQKTA